MSLERKIQKIENQLSGSLPVPETPDTEWAFDLARKRFGTPFDETARKVAEYFQTISTAPPAEQDEIQDTLNIHFEPDPPLRAAKIKQYASELIRKYGDEENYHRIRNENCPVTKYFQNLMESDGRQRALCEPVY